MPYAIARKFMKFWDRDCLHPDRQTMSRSSSLAGNGYRLGKDGPLTSLGSTGTSPLTESVLIAAARRSISLGMSEAQESQAAISTYTLQQADLQKAAWSEMRFPEEFSEEAGGHAPERGDSMRDQLLKCPRSGVGAKDSVVSTRQRLLGF